jgi:hypothetical protein
MYPSTPRRVDLEKQRVSDARLWEMRSQARHSLIEYVRERLARQLAASGAPPATVDGASTGKQVVSWHQALEQTWPSLRFGVGEG